MRHVKRSALSIVCSAVGFLLLFAFLQGLSLLLIFPAIAFTLFAALYLVRQGQKDIENNIKDGVRYTIEDQEADQWIKHDLAPRTFKYIKHRHWPVIIYTFLFIMGLAYVWSYLTVGSEGAMRNLLFAGILFWIIVAYSFIAPRILNFGYKRLPKRFRKYAGNDWMRGYVFLLPLTFIAYVFSPFISSGEPAMERLLALPIFFLGYTFLFLCTMSILYLYRENKKEEEKRLKKSVKEYLKKGDNENSYY